MQSYKGTAVSVVSAVFASHDRNVSLCGWSDLTVLKADRDVNKTVVTVFANQLENIDTGRLGKTTSLLPLLRG